MNTSPAVRTNIDWLADLRSPGSTRDAALVDLRAIIMAGLPYALVSWLPPGDPQFDALVEDVAQETLMRVLSHLDAFEDRSQFTTWVHKIAVRVALTELRRRRWKDVSLERLLEIEGNEGTPRLMADPTPGPEVVTERADLLARLQRIIMEELTEKQRQAMIAVSIKGMPIEEVARRMKMERNALYKLMHGARLRLKRRMSHDGLTPGDVLAIFGQR